MVPETLDILRNIGYNIVKINKKKEAKMTNTKWNIYQKVDGMTDIVKVVVSENKPSVSKGQTAVKVPSVKVDWSNVIANPALAFPSAHIRKATSK